MSEEKQPIPASQAMFGFAESMKKQKGSEAVVAWADQVARSAFDLEVEHAGLTAKYQKAVSMAARTASALGAILDSVDARDHVHGEHIRQQLQKELPEFAEQFKRKKLVSLR